MTVISEYDSFLILFICFYGTLTNFHIVCVLSEARAAAKSTQPIKGLNMKHDKMADMSPEVQYQVTQICPQNV